VRSDRIAIDVPASPTAILRVMLVVSLAICAVSAITQVAENLGWDYPSRHAQRVLDVDEEQAIGAWWGSALLFLGAVLATSAAAASPSRTLRRGWWALSVFVLLISLDETIALHEVVSQRLRARFDTSGVLHHAWVVPATLILVVLAVLAVPFVRALTARTRRLLLMAGGLFVGGGLGFEVVGGPFKNRYGEQGLPYMVPTHLEEMLEMAGASVLVYALLTDRASAPPDAPGPGPGPGPSPE